MSKYNPNLETLSDKLPALWSVKDVGTWLNATGLGAYVKIFAKNEIGGEELLDLTESEVTSLGITKLGHRKKIMSSIKLLQENGTLVGNIDDETASSSSHGGSSSVGSRNESVGSGSNKQIDSFVVKLNYKDKGRMITVTSNESFDSLKRKIRKELHTRVRLYFEDDGGDVVQIRRSSHWEACKTSARILGTNKITLECRSRHDDDELYNTKMDAIIVSTETGEIVKVNKVACKLFGYSSNSLVGSNVSKLMTRDMAINHNDIMRRYVETGNSHILGKGRIVVGRKRSGDTFSLFLTLTEKIVNGRRQFQATCSPASKNVSAENDNGILSQFQLFNDILDCCVVIDHLGIIRFANKAFLNQFGYTRDDVLNQNVKMLMMGKDKENHDQYLSNYRATKKSSIIGQGRDVQALAKDGSVVNVHLSLTERTVSDTESYFVGMLRVLEVSMSVSDQLSKEKGVVSRLVVPAIIISSTGIITAFNDQLPKLFGYSREQLMDKNVSMLMPPPESTKHDEYLQRYVNDPSRKETSHVVGAGRDVIAKHRLGRLLPIRLSVSQFGEQDQMYFTGICQKI